MLRPTPNGDFFLARDGDILAVNRRGRPNSAGDEIGMSAGLAGVFVASLLVSAQ